MSIPLMSARHPDKVKKWMACLGCGRKMWTDRCHSICKKCRRRHDATPTRVAHRVTLPAEPALLQKRPSRPFDE